MRIVVVGAGLAGLSAARALQAAGHGVTVLDKGRSPSGRVATRRAAGLSFDHGAQYFTARDETFRRELSSWVAEGVAAEWTGRVGALEAGVTRPDSGRNTRYVGTPTMSAVARHLARGLSVRSSARVRSLQRNRKGWAVETDDGGSLGGFDAALVTVPAPQATPLLGASPLLAAEAARARLRPCWAVLAGWDQPLDVPLDGLFVEHPVLGWAARNTSKPGRPPGEAWVLHARPEWSEAQLENEPGEVESLLLEAFGDALARPLPPPRFITAHRWRFALPDPPLGRPCLYDPEVGLGAAGDWCGGPRVEGAFLSGLALARQLLAPTRGRAPGPPSTG